MLGTTITAASTITSSVSVSGFSFATPYTNYKLIFYISCLGFYGTAETTTAFPPSLAVSGVPISATQFNISVVVGLKVKYTYLHYTVIVYNSNDLAVSKIYRDTQGTVSLSSSTGGGYALPSGYDPYVMMGVSGFTGTTNNQTFMYALSIGTMSNSSYGLILTASTNAVTTLTVVYFYV